MIARRLSFISAQMDARYGPQLDGMVAQILPNILVATDAVLDHAYHVFQHVASNLFRDGQITWCRIIALLSFGYRLGVALFRHGVNHFVHFVVKLVTKFIVNERIYRWIIQRGGWFATLTYYLVSGGSFDTTTNFLFYSIWGLTIFTVTCLDMDDYDYEKFENQHKMQLVMSGVPTAFWHSLHNKLKDEIFDAGDHFSMICIEDNDESSDDNNKGDYDDATHGENPTKNQLKPRMSCSSISGSGSQRSKWKVVVCNADGVSINDPSK
uniref:Bcl-2 Bcl-2 homology region 1-3 domain-containing protein n=1 Tax=Romanomermis culicivorax TaxID=13658 RepID=A0A915KVL8_ROMCU